MNRTLGIIFLSLVVGASGCATASNTTAKSPDASKATASITGGVVSLPGGLKYEDLVVGNGPVAESGMKVSVHYTGWLSDGTKFDSSLDRGEPFKFRLGGGNVIRGWDEGVKGMKVGGKRKLNIPSDLGYGAAGSGPIPPNAALVFEVALLGVE